MHSSRTAAIVTLVAAAACVGIVVYGRSTVTNPDPNHAHADFSVWIDGEKLDFSGEQFMSGSSTDEPVGEHTDEDHKHPYLHLHDGNGHVIHRHKPELTFGAFLESLGFVLEEARRMPGGHTTSCISDPNGNVYCDDDETLWRAMINGYALECPPYGKPAQCPEVEHGEEDQSGTDSVEVWNYVFEDGDKILLDFGHWENRESELRAHYAEMTDDACLYSQTCPWRGTPPVENCVSDPTVPCVQ